jgi:type I restriction enzyme R subunit
VREYSEDKLVEQTALKLLADIGWQTLGAYHERVGAQGTLGRQSRTEVVLVPRLRAALERLNPAASREAIGLAIEELTRDRAALAPAQANCDVYRLLKDGVRVRVPAPDEDGEDAVETVRVVDWDEPGNNEFLAVSQLWLAGEVYTRRADVIGFVNGLPLVFLEFKKPTERLEDAYTNNLRDYKATIPGLWWYNALVVLSNGLESRVGSMTAGWEHFAEWKRVASEDEPPRVSLETALRGTLEPARLLDLTENFTVFAETKGGLVKVVAKNHQFLGVNNALAALERLRATPGDASGRLGVFWHTQGAGKTYSMVFFSQKVLRKVAGNWSFLVVTDRDDLDTQVYKTFAACGAVTEAQAQASSASDLQRLLREDHRYVFTLIQKFRTERGALYEQVSDRRDVIVMTDEAHRSQYDTFARNMRAALPNAAFIGFTGTPLMAGEERTREVFGDYVSIYNFREAVADGATVPLFYENRIPELQLENEEFGAQLETILEEAALDEAQEARLEREFAREYHLVTRDDRLERIAEDIARHFLGRDPGANGKAMVVSIDKATAVRMYEKVRFHWTAELKRLKAELLRAKGDAREGLIGRIRFMESTDMAVIVSQAQNEVADFAQRGLQIAPHRARMVKEDLETKFKDASDPLRIVFVCAMWMTGFDAPAVSTIYLDKPMRNHTLMQTIARANRVWGDKVGGLIVDYVGVFRDLQRALAVYGATLGRTDDTPVQPKGVLVEALRAALEEARTFCEARRAPLEEIASSTGLERLAHLEDAVEALVGSDDDKRAYLSLAATIERLYKAILPDALADSFVADWAMHTVIAERIRKLAPPVDVSGVVGRVEELLDASIAAEGYVIRDSAQPGLNLSKIDFEALAARFARGRKRSEAERLRGNLNAQIERMVRVNRTRVNYLERFQAMIEAYNAGSHNIEAFFHDLLDLSRDLSAEEVRHVREGLSEEELAVFDLIVAGRDALSAADELQIKGIARTLLETLKRERLVLDWRKKQQAKARVRQTVEDVLDRLPDSIQGVQWLELCDAVYAHVFEMYRGDGQSVYSA